MGVSVLKDSGIGHGSSFPSYARSAVSRHVGQAGSNGAEAPQLVLVARNAIHVERRRNADRDSMCGARRPNLDLDLAVILGRHVSPDAHLLQLVGVLA